MTMNMHMDEGMMSCEEQDMYVILVIPAILVQWDTGYATASHAGMMTVRVSHARMMTGRHVPARKDMRPGHAIQEQLNE